jgi:hypothetical protein
MCREGGGPAAFDPSEFPSLAPGVGAPGGMPGRPNYGKQNEKSMNMYGIFLLDTMVIGTQFTVYVLCSLVKLQRSGFLMFSSMFRIRDVLIRIRIRRSVTWIPITILLFSVTFMMPTKRELFLPSFSHLKMIHYVNSVRRYR